MKGLIEPATGRDGAAGWRFEIDGVDGKLAADELDARPLTLDKLVMRGIAFPDSGRAEVSQFLMNAGPANIAMAGTIAATGNNRVARLDGRIGPMPLDALKAMWPQGLAPQTRQWVAGRIVTGQLTGGSFSITSQRPERARCPRCDRRTWIARSRSISRSRRSGSSISRGCRRSKPPTRAFRSPGPPRPSSFPRP